MTYVVRERQCRGLRTSWLQAGRDGGPLVVLLHGFPDDPHIWEPQIEHFTDAGYQVIAPFVRGLPQSQAGGWRRWRPQAIVLDVLEILNEVDPGQTRPVHIVGHDVGSIYAWGLAQLLVKRCHGLVIINGLTIAQMARRLGNPRQLWRSWYMLAMQLPVLPQLLAVKFPQRILRSAYRRGGLAPAEYVPSQARSAAELLKGPLNQYRAGLREIPRALVAARRPLPAPVLVLWGADDAFLVPPTEDELGPDAADLTIRILPGNHWLQREQAERVNKLVAEFFARKPT